MTEIGALSPDEASATSALSQGERVIDTYIAPSKTFTDILRSQSWWLPFLIMVVVGYAFIFTVEKKVGWEQVLENSLKTNASQAEQISNAPAAQQATIRARMLAGYKYVSYGFLAFVLLYWVVASAVMLGTLNFGFGGRATFGQMFAVFVYAGLPGVIKSLLSIIVMFAGLDAESFNLQNPVGTNLGYYLPPESSKWLISLGTSIDIFTLWTIVVLIIGCAIVAKVKRSSAAIAVIGWWLLFTIASVGLAAFQG